MKQDRTSTANEELGFEDDERPTRPAAPAPEHLEATRTARARVLPRSRPALTPATQSWLTVTTRAFRGPLRTATNRWRAVAAAALQGGSARKSVVDPEEAAAVDPEEAATVEPPTPPIAQSGARLIAAPAPAARRELGPGGTVRIPARRERIAAPTVKLPRAVPPLLGRRERRWLLAGAIASVLALGIWIALGAFREPAPPAVTTGAEPVAVERATTPPATSPADPPPATGAAPSAPALSPSRRTTAPRTTPGRNAPHAGSNVF
ncbi:MAG TPA: hypothetical protein VIF15_17240 [Polyangiaceae bacterium]|jgi:hypothetical protein